MLQEQSEPQPFALAQNVQQLSTRSGLDNHQRIAILEDQFSALEKLLQKELPLQLEQLQKLETRVHGLETKSFEERGDNIGLLRMQLLEHQVKHVEKRLQDESDMRVQVEERLGKACDDLRSDLEVTTRQAQAALCIELPDHSKNSGEMMTAMQGQKPGYQLTVSPDVADNAANQLKRSSATFFVDTSGSEEVATMGSATDEQLATSKRNYGRQDSVDILDMTQSPVPHAERTQTCEIDITHSIGVDPPWDRVYFAESIWDAPMFVGLGLSFVDDSQTIFIFILNMYLQILFTYLAGTHLISDSVLQNDLQGLKYWRMHYGHNLQYESQGRSLVARVCMGTSDLEVSGQHLQFVGNASQYLVIFNQFLCVGQVLFFIATYCWSLIVASEINQTIRLMGRLSQLPQAMRTEIVQTSSGDKQLRMLNRFRLMSSMLTLAIRGAIAGFILIFGIQWLAQTVAVEDLLLNAVALEFVFSLDERIYDTLIPTAVRELIAGMYIPRAKDSLILTQHMSLMRLVFISCVLGISIPVWLLPQVSKLANARSVLCSGNLDFVVTRTSAHPFFGWSQTSVGTDAKEVPMRNMWDDDPGWNYFEQVIATIIRTPSFDEAALQNTAVQTTRFSNLYGTPGSLATFSSQTSRMANYLTNRKCRDATVADFSDDGWHAMVSELNHVPNLPKPCNHTLWVWACNQPDRVGEIARLFCPEACGCNTPASAQVLSGCPEQCVMTTAWKMAIETKHCCRDSNRNHLLNSTIWRSTVTNFNNSGYGYRGVVSNLIQVAAESLSALGCEGVSEVRGSIGLDLCDDGANLPGLMQFRYWCPVACYCTNATKGCPSLHIGDHDLDDLAEQPVKDE